MKPRLLKIKGLNSFVEEQMIDFTKLTEYGLFGIFGPTGSGKSTILDAITLALYGEIPRCGKVLRGVINTSVDKLYVYYEFEIGSGIRRQAYCVERVLKRTKDDKIATDTAIVCDITDPSKREVLSERVTETNQMMVEIIGLNADDFMRSVVLPQGNFSEFLKLKGAERRRMLERIFGLEEYGEKLMGKAKGYQERKNRELSELEGELKGYEDVSQEILKQLEKQNQEMLLQKQDIQKRYEKIERDFEKYRGVWELQQELEKYQQRLNVLQSQGYIFLQKEEMLDRAKKAADLKPLIEKVRQRERVLKDRIDKEVLLKTKLDEVSDRLGEIESEWKLAVERKERELPALTIKGENLKRAVEINGTIRGLEIEFDKLLKYHQAIVKDKEEKQGKAKKISKEMDRAQRQLKNIEGQIKELTITPEYRLKLEEAWELEKGFKQLSDERESLQGKILMLEGKVSHDEKNLQLTTQKKEEVEKALEELKSQKAALEESFPGDHKTLAESQKDLSQLENQLKEVGEIDNQISVFKEKQSQLEEMKRELEKELKEEQEEYSIQERMLQELELKRKNLHIKHTASLLAKELKEGVPCPVCGSSNHPNPSLHSNVVEEMEGMEEEWDVINGLVKKHGDKVADYKARLTAIDLQIKDVCINIKQWASKLNGRNTRDIEKRYELKKREFESLARGIDDWEKSMKELSISMEEKNREVGELKAKEASIQSALEGKRSQLDELITLLREYQCKLEGIRKDYESAKEELGLSSIAGQIEAVRGNERQIEKLRNQEEGIKIRLEEWGRELKDLEREISQLEVEGAKAEGSCIEIKKKIEENIFEVHRLSDGKAPEAYLAQINKEIEQIKKVCQSLDEAYQREKEHKEQLANQYVVAAEHKKAIEAQLKEDNMELAGRMAEKGFSDADMVIECYMDQKGIDKLEKELSAYNDELKILKDRVDGVEARLKGERIEEEEWMKLKDLMASVKKQLEEKAEELVRLETKKADIEKKLKVKQELMKQKKELEHQCGLIDKLMSMLRGKRFVDFIARRQLQYIAREASRRLKGITRGRYALELDSDGNFIMRDDYNGGARRPAHTLSGGETFVTSLSLALALSTHIQLGKANLEFFFLDEGFGTLDSELLDVVINSLEQLGSERLSVGLISHVDELRQRIPRKLLVQPAVPGERGTLVVID